MGAETKAELRARLRAARAALDPELRRTASREAARRLAESEAFRRAGTIALYAAFGSEADPGALDAAAREHGARVVYPRVDEPFLVFHLARPDELHVAPSQRFPIPTPRDETPAVALGDIDLFVVPGLGFTRAGERLGYGRGHYDRALAAARRTRAAGAPPMIAVGFAFSIQLTDALPATVQDQPVDAVVTENELFFTRDPAVIVAPR